MSQIATTETFAGNPPVAFTQDEVVWQAWLEPVAVEDLTERQKAALVNSVRIRSAYFRLLARDPDILETRTKTDLDIFYNLANGLPRAERELAATTVSRHNGCIYCASVHARRATQYSKRRADLQRLLDEGVGAKIDPRWDAIVAASAALTSTPVAFDAAHVARLRDVGLGDDEIVDVINAASFFAWANRLMLSLGGAVGAIAPDPARPIGSPLQAPA